MSGNSSGALAADEQEASCSTNTALLLRVTASASALSAGRVRGDSGSRRLGFEATQDPFCLEVVPHGHRNTETTLMQGLFKPALDSIRRPFPSKEGVSGEGKPINLQGL